MKIYPKFHNQRKEESKLMQDLKLINNINKVALDNCHNLLIKNKVVVVVVVGLQIYIDYIFIFFLYIKKLKLSFL